MTLHCIIWDKKKNTGSGDKHSEISQFCMNMMLLPNLFLFFFAAICLDFFFNDRETEHFKALTKNDHLLAIADHVKATNRVILIFQCQGNPIISTMIKETLYLQGLKPTLNVNISSEKLILYQLLPYIIILLLRILNIVNLYLVLSYF